MEKIPNWLRRHLKPGDLEAIEGLVREVEMKTSAELVPILVRRSSTVGHVPVILFLCLLFSSFALGLHEVQEFYFNRPWIFIPLHLLMVSVLSGALSHLSFFQRLLTSAEDIEHQVDARARLEFYECDTHRTRGATGILIFVSWMERRVVVLADKAISDRHPPEIWSDVVNKILAGIKSESFVSGLRQGLSLCGDILAKDFPLKAGDRNELPNQLTMKE